MKKLIFIIGLLFTSMAFASGLISKDFAQQGGMQPTPAVTYNMDCTYKGMAQGLHRRAVVTASGVGTLTTITIDDATPTTPATHTWIQTIDTSVSGVTDTSCAQPQ